VPLLLALLLAAVSCAAQPIPLSDDVLALAFAGRPGAFVLIDCATGAAARHDPAACAAPLPPCSTFKIWNTAIGLENGLVGEPDAPFWKWDGQVRAVADWNQDQTLRSAFAVSCVPAYQALARKTGPKRMAAWLTKLGYGDRDLSAGIDRFWLAWPNEKSLLISADAQAEEIVRLATGKLPLAPHTRAVLAEIMRAKRTENGILYGKTGGSGKFYADGRTLGWYVGYVESRGRTYAFACNLIYPGAAGKDARALVEDVLAKAGLL